MVSRMAQGIIIGCVDNAEARRSIARGYNYGNWWLDAGNGQASGQVLIGNAEGAAFEPEGICRALPLPTIQRPELLVQVPSFPGRAPPQQGGCVEIAEQGPTINQSMASLVVEVVRRIIEGTCSWMQLYLDMQAGSLHPVMATPEAVEMILGKKRRKLTSKGGDASELQS
jgi:hypothetical protein